MQRTTDLTLIFKQDSHSLIFKHMIYQGESDERAIAYAEYGVRKCVLTCPKHHLFGVRIQYFGMIINMVRLSSRRFLMQYPKQVVLFRTLMHEKRTSFVEEAAIPSNLYTSQTTIASLDGDYI